MRSERCDSPDRQSRLVGTGPGWTDWRAVQWMNESLAKGANGQQSCWHTDHTQPHTHSTTCCHTHIQCHSLTHTWHVNKSAAFAVSRSSAWLGFALMLCCILYGVLGTLRVCQLPVASNRFVCIPFCLSASLPSPVLHSFILPCARITHSRVSICTKNSHVDCRLVHFDVIVRLISSLSSVWQSNC